MPGKSVYDLVKLYQQGQGADDIAGPALQARGDKARDELIRMLDDPATQEEDASTIVMILEVYFPTQESYAAVDRYLDRAIQDPGERARFKGLWRQARAKDPRNK